ncbi:hypothetical protein HanXRQr2_Chr14g0623571 [Helianthus annuus]|uniref:Uncharacterized protein n=1 Tax=Helianthus annuus TaxID=4232 RepID=A0A9K3E6N0_HELAN|nr:hypothetical protein HanXRQr2_Chr14g0623571 [Helianthus annuus]
MGLGLGLRFGAWPLWRGFEAVGRASKVTWRDLNGHVSTHAPNPSPTIPHGREFFFPFHVLTNAQPKPHHTPQSKLNASVPVEQVLPNHHGRFCFFKSRDKTNKI